MNSGDTPQVAYLRDLEAKRTAAFAFENQKEFDRQTIAAYRRTTGREWTPPIRTNEPLAGDACYEREAPVPQMTRAAWLVAAGCCLLAVYAAYVLLPIIGHFVRRVFP